MTRSDYYQAMRQLAIQKRQEYNISQEKITLTLLRKIYKAEMIKIDQWDIKGKTIRAAYFCDEGDCSVLLNKNLPAPQRLFSLAHELKHHFTDKQQIQDGKIQCGDWNANQVIEIGAEVFAAEFIYPESQMLALIQSMGITKENCKPESLVHLKQKIQTAVSYKFILKRMEWFGIIGKNQYLDIQFQKLEEQFYPRLYKQPWFIKQRARKKLLNKTIKTR